MITRWWIVFVVPRVRIAVNMVFWMVRGHPSTVVVVAFLTPTPVAIVVYPYCVGVLWWMLKPVGTWWTLESTRLWWSVGAVRIARILGWWGLKILCNFIKCSG